MEGSIFLGLVGLGYLIESKESHNIDTVMKPEIQKTSETSVYDINNYADSKIIEKKLLQGSHEKSLDSRSNVVNQNNGKDKIFNIHDSVEGYGQNVFSELLGTNIASDIFGADDRGVSMQPYFSGDSTTGAMNLQENTALNASNGGGAAQYYTSKTVVEGDKPTPYGNVFGFQDTGPAMDQDRYISSQYRTNDLPFQQEKVIPIHERSAINSDLATAQAQRNNIDNTRTISNQKVSFGGKVLPGKSISHRTKEGQVFKNSAPQDYEQGKDRWLTTTGEIVASSIRPEQVIPQTNRQVANGPVIGPVFSSANISGERRSFFKESDKQQLESDSFRNLAPKGKGNDDFSRGAFRSYPNERDVTQESKHEGQLSSSYLSATIGIQDKMKPTIKETVINTTNMDNPSPVIILPTDRLNDSVRVTRKETTQFDYTGIASGENVQEMASDQFYRADINANKEIISQGRSPTQVSSFLMSGEDTMNVDIKKIDTDSLTNRTTNASHTNSTTGGGSIPSWDSCVLTNDKDTLDNTKLSDRIDGTLLDPFRKNDYTHSLASFAY